MTLALTSCGLAATASPALAPDLVAHRAEIVTATEARPAEILPAAPAPLQKVVIDTPAVPVKPTLAAAEVAPMKHIWQSLNNCGPASVVMVLSSFGVDADQETARLALRGPDWRRGMSPVGVDPWVSELYGLRAIWRNNGTDALLKSLLSNGFPLMVTQWMEDPSVSRIAHWRAIAAYDDAAGAFYTNDPMRGRMVALDYKWFDKVWQPFSYRYLVMYRPEQEPRLRVIVGMDWSERAGRQRFYDRTRAEAEQRGDSASWLAFGEAAYQNGMFEDAVAAFAKGLSLGSAQGVFTLRSSYPQALRALGRERDAQNAQDFLNGFAAVPSAVASPPDSFALALAAERMRPGPREETLFSER